MIDPSVLDQLTKRINDSLPESVKLLQSDIEKNIRASLQAVFREMDLVTRDEFDVQSALLSRTLEKVAQLEKQIQALENQ